MNHDARRHVLVVDDDADIREAVGEILSQDGYSFVEAVNGKEALEFLVANEGAEPAVILLDMEMPVMTGWEFLSIVKSYSRFARIPVIVVSGTAPRAETITQGTFVAWIQKPYDALKLIGLVNAHAGSRQP